MKPIRVLVVGCGNMGTSHGLAYHAEPGFEVAGVVDRGQECRGRLAERLGGAPEYAEYADALAEADPDAVSICTYPETHAGFAIQALEAGKHVFLEKPIAVTVTDAERVAEAAHANRRKLVVGYILRHHPSWIRFIEDRAHSASRSSCG
jgi:predicted dehydrogenase